jgi:hypothetical protein
VDDGVVAADDRERVAGVGEVALLIGDGVAVGLERLPVTSCPASLNAATVAAPTLPRAPVTRMRIPGLLPGPCTVIGNRVCGLAS